VEKGLKSVNRLPIEVMGLMQGHMDTEEAGALVVTDVFPLPVEGTETSVLSDNPEVMNYMISLGESLESTRTEHFMGWYHSHPFDVGAHSNCFLSATDVSTQLSWQLSEDRAANPWLALVVDPLRGVAKGRPEIGAYRCYPPNFTPPRGTAPDGERGKGERGKRGRGRGGA
jgi:COP9 signalosome complex subunit 5